MRRCRLGGLGFLLAAFGVGLFIACCFPSSFLLAVISVVIVAIGVILIKK